jgi:hypothetical protein
MKRWAITKGGRILLTQLDEIKNKENDMVNEFDGRFRKLINKILDKIKPKDDVILLQYTKAYEGQFGLMLRDKFPTTLELGEDWAIKIEENMLFAKVGPLGSQGCPNLECLTQQIMPSIP